MLTCICNAPLRRTFSCCECWAAAGFYSSGLARFMLLWLYVMSLTSIISCMTAVVRRSPLPAMPPSCAQRTVLWACWGCAHCDLAACGLQRCCLWAGIDCTCCVTRCNFAVCVCAASLLLQRVRSTTHTPTPSAISSTWTARFQQAYAAHKDAANPGGLLRWRCSMHAGFGKHHLGADWKLISTPSEVH
jgi:hypothetical protein